MRIVSVVSECPVCGRTISTLPQSRGVERMRMRQHLNSAHPTLGPRDASVLSDEMIRNARTVTA